MKKIIIFLTVLCLVVSCFTISTFAVGNEVSSGYWTLNVGSVNDPNGSYPTFEQYSVSDGFNFTFAGKQFSGFYYNSIGLAFNLIGSNSDPTIITWADGKIVYSDEGVLATSIKINVPAGQTLPDSAYTWFTANFTYEGDVQCDGTSCPARDVDHNNICDDCGSVLVMSLRSPLLEYVYTTIDHVIENTFPDYDYWFISSSGDDYRIELSKEPFYYDSTTGALRASSDVQSARVFESANGSFGNGGWQHYSGPFTYTPLPNIVDSSHEINFPETPLWEEIQGVAEGQIQNKTLPRLGGTMTTVVICGISCLALVVLLVLLAKKFRIFLR